MVIDYNSFNVINIVVGFTQPLFSYKTVADLTHLVSRADTPVSTLYHFPVNEAHDSVLRTTNATCDTGVQHLQACHLSSIYRNIQHNIRAEK